MSYTKLTDSEFYAVCKKEADDIMVSVMGVSWDDLADSVSLWDYCDKSMTKAQLIEGCKEACIDKVEYEGDFDFDELNEMFQ